MILLNLPLRLITAIGDFLLAVHVFFGRRLPTECFKTQRSALEYFFIFNDESYIFKRALFFTF